MSRNHGSLRIIISGDEAITKALNAAIDGAKHLNGDLIIESNQMDIGDLRAQLNSTLRVINAALESMEKVK